MGAIAEAIVAYGKPLIDQTDGSAEQLEQALSLTQLCFNLALTPDDMRDAMLDEMRPALNMDDELFDEFRRGIVLPMIRRHEEMFPMMHRRVSTGPAPSIRTVQTPTKNASSAGKYAGTDRVRVNEIAAGAHTFALPQRGHCGEKTVRHDLAAHSEMGIRRHRSQHDAGQSPALRPGLRQRIGTRCDSWRTNSLSPRSRRIMVHRDRDSQAERRTGMGHIRENNCLSVPGTFPAADNQRPFAPQQNLYFSPLLQGQGA